MQLKPLIFSAFVASAAAVQRCAAPEPTEEQLEISMQMAADEANHLAATGDQFHIEATIATNVYFHVVASGTTVAAGYLTNATLDDQLDVMNEAYAPHGISFTDAGRDWTINANWAKDGAETAMKTALHKGTYADVNIYFVPTMDAFGYCYLPQTVSSNAILIQDGCTILSSTVPGGAETDYNYGYTVVHEVGHWFGLYHTFQGACGTVGDSVADTPPEKTAASGCPATRDTCTGGGTDPIHNYMDYSDDTCYTEFTAGQQTRMYSQWNTYRSKYVS
ncbi:putative Extracellular metalloprotease [Seiridium unicorne]|uniref:Extracellular metalloprotease n=1 Tax=Seiridium unicorne TaxID=138068 RepID=A0ABR2UVM8_9PEZI